MLSKSKYCAFSQCPKRLWLQTYRPELSEDNTALDARMETGNEVGDLAMGLFGDFTEVTAHKEDGRLDLSKMIAHTKQLVAENHPVICEASFSYEGNYCAVDILRRENGGYAIYEVKSATHASEIYGVDIAYQKYVLEHCGCDCFADDTGLEVDALGGAPGVYTARYAGDDKDFNKNMDKVLRELEILESERSMAAALGLKTKQPSRRARFKSVITLIINGEIKMFEGALEGVIAREKSGNGGFGYDPIFIADEYPGQTLADITEEQKNEISHRGKALRAMAEWLKTQNL